MPINDKNSLNDVSASINLVIPQGSNWIRRFQIKNKRTGAVQDLTGSTFKGEIRTASNGGTLIKAFTFTVIAGTPPTFLDISLSLADVAAITPNVQYYFDWFRIVATIPKRIAKGTFKVDPSSTTLP